MATAWLHCIKPMKVRFHEGYFRLPENGVQEQFQRELRDQVRDPDALSSALRSVVPTLHQQHHVRRSNGWAPLGFQKSLAAQDVVYIAVRAPARP